MSISLATRPRAQSSIAQTSLGRSAGWRLILAVFACAALACTDDEDPAEQTGVAGGVNAPDASVRDLPGDGREPTPDFDTDTRQREPIGPEELVENIEDIRDDIPTRSGTGTADGGTDEGTPADPSDAGG
jgi:hypothetical protein